MSDDGKCYAATPAATLEEHILNSNIAKSDTEWWAHHEITRLRSDLAVVTAERDRMRDALDAVVSAVHSTRASIGVACIDIQSLRRARAALECVTEPASPWRDIESAPRDGTKILAFTKSHIDYYGVAEWAEAAPDFQRSVAGWFWAFAIRPTHWMPLPEPPR